MKTKPKKVRVKRCNYCDTPNCKLPCHNNTNNQLKADQPRAGKLEEEFLKLLDKIENQGRSQTFISTKGLLEIQDFIHTNYISREEVENWTKNKMEGTPVEKPKIGRPRKYPCMKVGKIRPFQDGYNKAKDELIQKLKSL